jgi:hypothetical protein
VGVDVLLSWSLSFFSTVRVVEVLFSLATSLVSSIDPSLVTCKVMSYLNHHTVNSWSKPRVCVRVQAFASLSISSTSTRRFLSYNMLVILLRVLHSNAIMQPSSSQQFLNQYFLCNSVMAT